MEDSCRPCVIEVFIWRRKKKLVWKFTTWPLYVLLILQIPTLLFEIIFSPSSGLPSMPFDEIVCHEMIRLQ